MLKDTFQIYANRLVDISSRNRLIYQPQLVESQQIDLTDLDFLGGEPAFTNIEQWFGKRRKIPLIQQVDARTKAVNIQSVRLGRLFRSTEFTERESGEKSLFIAWPYIEGKLINEQLIRGPLLLLPVELKLDKNQWVLEKGEDAQPMLNPAFVLAYQHALGQTMTSAWSKSIQLPEVYTDVHDFLNQLYQLINDQLEINFTSGIYEKSLQRFPVSSKSLDQERFQTGKLTLKPFALLAQFQTKTGAMLADYQQLIEQTSEESLEEFFVHQFSGEHSTASVREENMYTVFPVDGSQEAVVKAVRQGRSCVVEGPPGTGKSQLICNLAIDYMARGKRVLIVSQKRTALDVVVDRLSSHGFGEFLGLVHDYRADRRQLYQKIEQQIDQLDQFKKENSSLDAIQLEREFSLVCRKIDALNEYFEEYRKALFNTEECGLPIKELYLTSSLHRPSVTLTNYFRKLDFFRLEGFQHDFKAYCYFADNYAHTGSFWLHRVDFSSFSILVQQRMQETLQEIRAQKLHFKTIFGDSPQFHISHLFGLVHQQEALQQLYQYLNYPKVELYLDLLKQVPKEQIDELWLRQKLDIVKSLFSEEGIEWSLQDDQLTDSLHLVISFAESENSWWNHHKRPWNKEKYAAVLELLHVNKLPVSSQGVDMLIKRIENRLNLNHQYTLLASKPWLQLPVKPFDFAQFNHFATQSIHAVQAHLTLVRLGELGAFIRSLVGPNQSLLDVVRLFIQELKELEPKLQVWSQYFTIIQINHLMDFEIGDGLIKIADELPSTFEELVSFDKLLHSLDQDEILLMDHMREEYTQLTVEELLAAFLNGWRLAWIDHIEQKYPVLAEASAEWFLQKQLEFTAAVEKKWALAAAIAQVRLREKTYQSLEFNRLGNLLTYRELKHQVSKQKRIWPVKQVMESFEEEIFRLVPCWLASPETVSSIFPLKAFFDLVIFDEASQCFAEKGLPAMLRAKQVVIAGDSQQLKPSDLYHARLEMDEESLDLEVDSLLDLSSFYFEKHWLQGHYRSEHLSLIQFSNQHFYENKLEMLPTLASLQKEEIPFAYHLVDGLWDKQMNYSEAEKVVEIIQEIQQSQSVQSSIGVITFNFYQMEHIQELLSKAQLLTNGQMEVKTIEHVQGDEYDTVILCLGYARNKKGKLIANFGSLSKQGGAQRLNVAVTRAKKKIHLVTSIRSTDFSAKQVENTGIQLLKQYLQFVEDLNAGLYMQRAKGNPKGFEADWQLHRQLRDDLSLYPAESLAWMDLVRKEKNLITEAILTDDERIYASLSGKESFVYHPLALRAKGWPYKFYFSRSFWLRGSFTDEKELPSNL